LKDTSRSPSGYVLLHKPTGITSFRALNGIKFRLGTGKVGHAGTLDPFAEGLLIVLCGSLTRLNERFSSFDKTYEASIRLGSETDTLDTEGVVIASAPVPSRRDFEEALPRFVGDQMQVPPVFSAIHVDGKRSHELARNGKAVELAPRPVSIRSIEMMGWSDEVTAQVRVTCSKGTYIRSLARDIGLACGSRGYLSALKRTAIGPFLDSMAVDPEGFDPAVHVSAFTSDTARALRLGSVALKPQSALHFMNGKVLADALFEEIPTEGSSCVFLEGDFVGMIERDASSRALSYGFVSGGRE
jgi:tRNA pseudouridine55 synthase